jgi:5-(carboxyamino)imidazole ribonucleotide synthase
VLGIAGAHVHHYGKSPRPGRKVGHVTITAPDETLLHARLAELRTATPELFTGVAHFE